MEELPKDETIKIISDENLYEQILKQDNYISSLSSQELQDYKLKESHYILSNKSISLEYFGAKHIFNPNHEQFQNIENYFNSFLEGKDLSKIVVFVEGSIPFTRANIEDDIRSTGERGFITHIAKNRNIEVRCIEPDRIAEIIYLLEKFPADQIEYYYYLRGIRDYFRSGRIQDDTSFETYTQELLDRHKKLFGELKEYSNFTFSLESIKKVHKRITKTEFDQNSRLDINPRNTDTVINSISKMSSNYRDYYHIRAVEEVLKENRSVFIVNGEDHAIIQKPSLELIFGKL